jgi:DNA-binding NtrC family response regulator
LSQVYGFITQSGGHVKVDSEPGRGTSIRLYLPRLLKEADNHSEDEPGEPSQGQHGETILVVEDDEDLRAYLIETLRDLNYRALRAHDAVSALGFIEHTEIPIHLLLTDVVLPGINGGDLARTAQAVRPDLKVLFMTGYADTSIVHEGRADVDPEVMRKPITQDQLAARVRAILDSQRRII